MSDHENQEPNAADESRDREASGQESQGASGQESNATPTEDASSRLARRSDDEAPSRLPLVLPPLLWEKAADERPRASWIASVRRHAAALVTLALAVGALGAATYVMIDHRRQADLLAERAQENAELAQTVSALNSRLQAIESAKGRDELAELRRSVGDMKIASASSRELSAAIAQLSQRVEKLDREQGAKLDKLGEHVDRETNARAAELSARLDKLEKKPASSPPPSPASLPPKFGANVSMDPTGSIDRPKPALRGYVVLGAQGDVALIGGRYGERAVRAGDYLPGAGRVERVERQGANWIVVTEQGLIASAYATPN